MGVFDRDKWQEIFATMRKNKLRSILTALGVFWGIFMLVFLLGMGKGLENGVYKDFGGRVKNIMNVWSNRTSMPYKGFSSGRRIRMDLDDLRAIQSQISDVKMIAPRTNLGNLPVTYKDQQSEFEVRGELTDIPKIIQLVVYNGRYINEKDVEDRRKVAVIGESVKEVLFGEEDAINKHIRVRGVDFKVVGVYGPEQKKSWTRDDMESVVIPLSTMSQAFGTNDRVHWFMAIPHDGISVASMEPKIRNLLKERHDVHPDDPEGIGGFNLEAEYGQIQALFLGIKLFLWFVGIGTLIAGIVGVSNIMLIIVKERTKEIGIRKALGASPRSIIGLILTESIFITSISGYLGLAFGTIIIWGLQSLMFANDVDVENFYNPQVNLQVGLFAMIVLIIAGAIAGLIPALQASRVNPVVALKDE